MNGRERRAVMLGLGVAGAAAFARVGAAGVGWYLDARERVAAAEELLARQAVTSAALRQLERRADSLRSRVTALAERLLPGRTEAEAQSELLTRVQSSILGEGAVVQMEEVIPDSVEAGLIRRVSARAAWAADLDGALRVIRRLEFGPTTLLVDRVKIDQSAAGDPSIVHVDLTVRGWYLAGRS